MTLRRLLIAALAAPLLSACVDTNNQTMGGRIPPGGTQFQRYVALGTSISAGFQSGGMVDSTQRQAYPVLLAQAMGLTIGASFTYPSLAFPGCPPPYTNILTGAKLGGASAPPCATRAISSVGRYANNLSIPAIRTAQVLNIDDLSFPRTDTLQLSEFITGGASPIAVMRILQPTFVTLEIGANDLLGGARAGDTTLFTPIASFQASFKAITDSIAATNPPPNVAVANLPAWQAIPHFSLGVIFFCLKNGGCPAPLPPATVPYSLATFTVNASCAPSAVGGVGDSTLVGFTATGTITSVLAGGGAASLNCGAGTATVTTAAGTAPTGPILSKPMLLSLITHVNAMNTEIATVTTGHGWALVNFDSTFKAAQAAGKVAGFPDFTKPTSTIFGTVFSLDGLHPNAAGHKLMAQAFANAINLKYGSTLAP
jgi:hypothetical protein